VEDDDMRLVFKTELGAEGPDGSLNLLVAQLVTRLRIYRRMIEWALRSAGGSARF
jgi:hypothetical protein